MIAVKLYGRLGNQLFQYAFAYSTAKKLNTLFAIDDRLLGNNLGYFRLRRFEKIRNRLLRVIFTRINNVFQKNLIVQNNKKDPKEIAREDHTYYEGYFQSEKYFAEHADEIKRLFRIKRKYIEAFDQQFGNIFSKKKVVAVHIRRTDYAEHGNEALGGKDLRLPLDYYKKALSKIEGIENYQLIFIGDDLAYIKENFKGLGNTIFTHNSEIEDFQVLMNADICIISNSSFAWWAAYLNSKPDKRILAPSYWLGFKVGKEYPDSVLCKEWEQISVNG